MKRLFLLVVLLLFAYLIYNRQRVFLRDPLASVLRDGTRAEGTQVFINFNNDVLLEKDGPPLLITLLQQGKPVGTPANLKCVHFVACLTDADSASLSEVEAGARIISMANKIVEYKDGEGHSVVITLW